MFEVQSLLCPLLSSSAAKSNVLFALHILNFKLGFDHRQINVVNNQIHLSTYFLPSASSPFILCLSSFEIETLVLVWNKDRGLIDLVLNTYDKGEKTTDAFSTYLFPECI